MYEVKFNKNISHVLLNFWASIKGLPYATELLSCLSVLSACNVGVLWSNGWMDQDATCTEVGLSPGDIMLHGDPGYPAPTHRKGTAARPTFWPMSIVAKWSPISVTAEPFFYKLIAFQTLLADINIK